MLYEQRPDTVEAWRIVKAHTADPMNGQDLEIEDGRTVHISAQDLSRSGVNPNPGDVYAKLSSGVTTVVAKANFERKWREYRECTHGVFVPKGWTDAMICKVCAETAAATKEGKANE